MNVGRTWTAALLLIMAASFGAGVEAMAHERRHHHAAGRSAPAEPRQGDSRFYPESIEGGVHGNLPFNNQLRKLSDPLNANGGR